MEGELKDRLKQDRSWIVPVARCGCSMFEWDFGNDIGTNAPVERFERFPMTKLLERKDGLNGRRPVHSCRLC